MAGFTEPTTARIAAFLDEIGLEIEPGPVREKTILPGIEIQSGAIVVDEARLLYPGDLLHEAGHLAVLTREQRGRQEAEAGDDLGAEIGAICWSYAAAVYIQIDPALVFHPHGYRGASQWHLENYREGRNPGVPLLQSMGLTADEKRAKELGVAPYPHMLRWLRE